MNLAYILNSFPRLHNTFTLNTLVGLLDQGHDLSVFSMTDPQETVKNRDVARVQSRVRYAGDILVNGRQDGAKTMVKLLNAALRRFPSVHFAVGQMLFGASTTKAAIDKHFAHFGWKAYALARIAATLQREGIEIIHAGFGNRPATVAMALADLTGIPFTFETHAYDLFVDFPFADEKIRKASKIFTISHYNRRYLMETYGCPPDKIAVVRVPINRTHCDKLARRPKQDGLVVSVCRLHPIKGLGHALVAFKKLTTSREHARLVIVGDGPLRNELATEVRRLSLDNRVTLIGDITNEEALQHIADASVFLLPSVIAPNGDRDGIPTSLIEAMYLRTPVISSRVSGIPELVDDGVNGFLTEPGDTDQIAERLDQLLGNEKLRDTVGANARQKIEEEFYGRGSVESLVDAWGEIVGREGTSRNAG